MSDKMRPSFPTPVSFADGEMPTAAKLRGLATQAKNSSNLLEYAVGDLWNMSGDGLLTTLGLTTNALMIPNLARYVGAARLLNPVVPYLSQLTKYLHDLSAEVGKYETRLPMPPASGSTFTFSGTGAPTTRKTILSDVDSTGDWYVDYDTGYCRFFDQIYSDWTITYKPNALSSTDKPSTATFNVIPDPDTDASYGFRGCKIAYTNNTDNTAGYIITLPPRGPLSASVRSIASEPQNPYTTGNTVNMTTVPASTSNIYYWQADSVDATTDTTTASHYRYCLPRSITDAWSNGSVLPTGLLYLWDHSTTGTIITGLSYSAVATASPPKWQFIVSGAAMDTWVTNYMTTAGYPADSLTKRDTHDSSYYPANGLRVITVGADVSSVLNHLVLAHYNHDHGVGDTARAGLVPPVNHKYIVGSYDSDGAFDPSAWNEDWHPQYLHRYGDANFSVNQRDKYGNGMFGNLLFLSTGSTDDYQNLTSDSVGIIFGHPTTGPWLQWVYVNQALTVNKHFQCHEQLTINEGIGSTPCIVLSSQASTRIYTDVAANGGGSLSIESDSSPVDGKEGGSLYCAKYYSGYENDPTYGYSNGAGQNYGPVRLYFIGPEEMRYFYTTDDAGDEKGTTALSDSIEIDGTPSGVGSVIGKIVQTGAAGTNYYAFAHLKIPYLEYCIVDALLDIKHNAGSTRSLLYAGIGWSGWTALGATIESVSATVDLTTLETGAGWSGKKVFAGSTTMPILAVNNLGYSVTSAAKVPWFWYKILGSAGSFTLRFRPVVILYRVKQY